MLLDCRDERLGPHLHADVDHVEAGSLEHDVDEVLADVVHVALNGAHQEGADLLDPRIDEQRAEELERTRHRSTGDQHLRDEEVAALESGSDLLERRDQRLEEQRVRIDLRFDPAGRQFDDRGLVADECLVVDLLQDFFVRHSPRSPG